MSERLTELTQRLLLPGGKAAHVSASELHELVDELSELHAQLEAKAAQVEAWREAAEHCAEYASINNPSGMMVPLKEAIRTDAIRLLTVARDLDAEAGSLPANVVCSSCHKVIRGSIAFGCCVDCDPEYAKASKETTT